MEEIYVIKLRGLPPAAGTPSSSTSSETRDLLLDAILGLGVSHLVLGSVSFLLGILGLVVEDDSTRTGAGVWCGLVFLTTGIGAVLAAKNRQGTDVKTKMRVCFYCSCLSVVMATVYLVISCLTVSYFHQNRDEPTRLARVGGNAIVTAFVELIVATLTIFASARAIWPCFWLSLRCSEQRSIVKHKVIVSADVLGSPVGPKQALAAVRHVSPNCVISFKQVDDPQKLENAKRVEEYVRNGCIWSHDGVIDNDDDVTVSDYSSNSSFPEEDNCVDYVCGENWKNETVQVVSVPGQNELIPYYPKDYNVTGC